MRSWPYWDQDYSTLPQLWMQRQAREVMPSELGGAACGLDEGSVPASSSSGGGGVASTGNAAFLGLLQGLAAEGGRCSKGTVKPVLPAMPKAGVREDRVALDAALRELNLISEPSPHRQSRRARLAAATARDQRDKLAKKAASGATVAKGKAEAAKGRAEAAHATAEGGSAAKSPPMHATPRSAVGKRAVRPAAMLSSSYRQPGGGGGNRWSRYYAPQDCATPGDGESDGPNYNAFVGLLASSRSSASRSYPSPSSQDRDAEPSRGNSLPPPQQQVTLPEGQDMREWMKRLAIQRTMERLGISQGDDETEGEGRAERESWPDGAGDDACDDNEEVDGEGDAAWAEDDAAMWAERPSDECYDNDEAEGEGEMFAWADDVESSEGDGASSDDDAGFEEAASPVAAAGQRLHMTCDELFGELTEEEALMLAICLQEVSGPGLTSEPPAPAAGPAAPPSTLPLC